ncbi:hypothetical protein GAYE_SCF53G6154 [Galdieria yellowstonensis]|uniref:SNF7 family protein n=1 Tax=Galdieria yellowstonensis TaxID=3028027 RepID=A0AAV9ILP4_9RHOD|nr:hypothetical protein GAYE_SCF53G6154 [Galdieria yellowstonensis]
MGLGEFLFGVSPQERVRRYKRGIDRAIREMDRERTKLEQQERKVKSEIRKLAKEGQMQSVKTLAKDLVRTRSNISKFYSMRTQMQSVSMQLTAMRSNEVMAKAMAGVVKAMRQMNRQMNLPEMQKILMEFEKQNEIMGMKQEIMDDTIDDTMGADEEEAETEQVVNQVLDELGLETEGKLGYVPRGSVQNGEKNRQEAEEQDDLESRLENLRK